MWTFLHETSRFSFHRGRKALSHLAFTPRLVFEICDIQLFRSSEEALHPVSEKACSIQNHVRCGCYLNIECAVVPVKLVAKMRVGGPAEFAVKRDSRVQLLHQLIQNAQTFHPFFGRASIIEVCLEISIDGKL